MDTQRLNEMFAELRRGRDVYSPSPFWEELNRIQIHQLETEGLENLKRTVNLKYFNWGVLGVLANGYAGLLRHWLRSPTRVPLFSAPRSGYASGRYLHLLDRVYSVYLLLLRDYVGRIDRLKLLDRIEEPLFGNPFYVERDGRRVSQDLCNSIHELYMATRCLPLDGGGSPSLAEIGAGYGRLAYAALEASPSLRYTIIDIPPALYVSQEYLTRVLPRERAFTFRPFDRFSDVEQEFEAARIRFLAAHQIELLPDRSFDVVINVSSLHEMTRAQIENYFVQIDRIAKGYFYTKQWRRSRALQNGFRISEHEYPVPAHWKTVFQERHPIQRMFFHALYQVVSG